MKIAQLSAASGQSISTIKFYIREGLLPPGCRTARNQAVYDESHVRRLALIAILKDELLMSVEEMVRVFAVTKGRASERATGVSKAHGVRDLARPETKAARVEVLATARDMGWLIDEEETVAAELARHVATIQRLLPGASPRDYLSRFAHAMNELALLEIEEEDREVSETALDQASLHLLRTCAFEPLLIALRRVARTQRLAQLREMKLADGES